MNEKEMYPQQKKYDKGSAPKVTREMVEANIWSFACVNAYEAAKNAQTGQGAPSADLSRVTLCLMTLRNGAVVVGSSTCAHMDNFDQRKGESAAYDDAFRQAWNLMGYALRDRLGSMSQYQDLSGVTRDADGEESFEQLKWATNNDPRVRPGHEPAAPADPTKAEKRRAMSFFDAIKPGLDAWFGTGVMKDGEPIGKLKNVRMEDGVMRAEVEFDAPEDVVLNTSILGEFNYDSVMEAMKQAHEQAIKGASAAYRIPERLLRAPSITVSVTPANDKETLAEIQKRVKAAVQSVIGPLEVDAKPEPKAKKVKGLLAYAKGAHDAFHGAPLDTGYLQESHLVFGYDTGYNMVLHRRDYSEAWQKRVETIVHQFCCLNDWRAENMFEELVWDYIYQPVRN